MNVMNKAEAAEAIPAVVPSARAKRRIGNYFDELARGMNPFGYIANYGVADATASTEEIVELFDKFNIVKLRGVYPQSVSQDLNRLCIEFSGLKPLDFRNVYAGTSKGFTGGAPVLNDKRFWPYAANEHVRRVVLGILGENSFEFGSSVAAHYAARGLHRDYRQLCEKEGSAYNINNPQKRIIRVLHYCASEHMHGGMLGVIPFSHDERKFAEQSKRIGLKRPTAWFDRHREVLTDLRKTKDFTETDEIDRHVVWVATDPGDVLITNSATLHCGEHLTVPRYFFVSTYAEANEETLPFAVPQIKTETAKEYLRYMSSLGFLGSKAILNQVANAAKAAAAPAKPAGPAAPAKAAAAKPPRIK